MPSWKAIDCSSKVPQAVGSVDVDEEGATAAPVTGGREVERLRPGQRRLDGARRLGQHVEPAGHRLPRACHRRPRRPRRAARRSRSAASGRCASPRRSASRSSVPTTSGPSARYSSASFSICASPISWISWAVLSVVVKNCSEAAYASSPPSTQLRPARSSGRASGSTSSRSTSRYAAIPGRTSDSIGRTQPAAFQPSTSRPSGGEVVCSRGSSATGVDEQSVELGEGVPDGELGRHALAGDALALPLGQVAVEPAQPAQLVHQRFRDLGSGQRQHAHDDRHVDLDPEDRVGGELGQSLAGQGRPGWWRRRRARRG